MGAAMGAKKVKPPKLPAGAPKDLRAFVACKVMEVDIDPTQVGWIPRPELVPESLAPTVTPTGNGSNAVNVAIGWDLVALTLPISLADGQLQIDTTNLPGQHSIDEWVKSFNDALKSNNKELSGLEVRDGKIHITKREIAAPAAPVDDEPKPEPKPEPEAKPEQEPTEGTELQPWYLVGLIAAFVLLMGVAVAWVVRDDPSSADSMATTSTQASTTTAAPIDPKLICANPATLEHVLDEFGVEYSCEIQPDDYWDACDAAFMPCFSGAMPLIVLSPGVGISHDGTVPDAVTGQTGPSQAEHRVEVVGPLADTTASVEVASQCGGDTLSGQAPLVTTGVTAIRHPLLNLGACAANVYYRTTAARQIIGHYDFTVSDAAVPAGQPATVGITTPSGTALNAAGTTLGLLGGKPLDPTCTWFTATSALLNPAAECASDHWIFNAAYNEPRVASFGVGFVNPLGVVAPTAEQIASFGPSRLFGPGTLFPCGPGQFGDTACAQNQATVDTSAFVAATVSWSTPLNEVPDGTFAKISVGDYWIQLVRDGESWTLTAQDGDDSQVRAILRGNSITFMIPHDEPIAPDLLYTLSTGDDQHRVEVGQTPQPAQGAVTSNQGPETPADFFQQLSNSFASGDLTYALSRLHPLVLEAFPGDVCNTELALRVAPDYRITVNSVGETAPWVWELPDGRSIDVEQATTVSILLPGATEPVDSHLVNIDRKYYWFTTCDGR